MTRDNSVLSELSHNQTPAYIIFHLKALRDIYFLFSRRFAFTLSSPTKGAFTLLMFDINGLKRANDTQGHEKGNQLIAAIGSGIDRRK